MLSAAQILHKGIAQTLILLRMSNFSAYHKKLLRRSSAYIHY